VISQEPLPSHSSPIEINSNRKHTPDDLWNILYEADKKRFIMGCGTGDIMGQGTDSQDPTTGLCGNHAYSLIGVYEVLSEGRNKRRLRADERGKYPANMVERLVKIRNPWAIGEWIGDWNLGKRNPARNAEQWSSPQLTKELHRSDNPNDGTFHMPFNSFLQYFDEIQVCYYYDNYKYSAQKYQSSPKEPTIIKFDLGTPGDYYFSLIQVSSRMFKPEDKYTYTQLTLILAREVSPCKFEYLNSTSKIDEEMWVHVPNCTRGTYFAYILTPWKRSANTFTFSVYGPGETTLSPLPASTVGNHILEKLMTAKARGNRATFRNYSEQGHPQILYKAENSSDSFGYFYFLNESTSTQLTANINIQSLVNIEQIEPYTGRQIQLRVPPGQDRIIIYRMGPGSNLSYSLSASFQRDFTRTIDQIKSAGKREERLDPQGRPTGIYLYTLNSEKGFSMYYDNTSTDCTLEEWRQFDLRGYAIEGVEGNIAPGSRQTW
jgi:hypothetical protein